ncbi:MAG: TPM domain-containing protein [Methylovulum sp.]|nr:TPM domain-containing protein [Methylovulum sp.]
MRRIGCGLGLLLLWLCGAVWAQVDVPELSRRVTDLTMTLNDNQINRLERALAAFEAKKGSQIAVLVVPTTQPEDIAQFGIRVADTWKIGREKADDGVILIIAKDDHKMRLEVGYGLEGAIPDAVAKRVLDDIMAPYFKKQDFAGGINAGVRTIMGLIEGEALPAPQIPQASGQVGNSFMVLLFAGAILGYVLSAVLGRVLGGLLAGLGSAAAAIILLGLSFGIAVFIAVIVFFIVGVRQSHRSGWLGGGGFGGGGGSWGGGGGGFGGGGASGSW